MNNSKILSLLAFFLVFALSQAAVFAENPASEAMQISADQKENLLSNEETATKQIGPEAPDKEKTDNNEVLELVDRALNPESYVSYKKIINIDTKGVKKEFVMYVGKLGRDKVLGAFLAPKSELGRATLRIGDNMWLYIPNVRKPVRITSLQSVTGGLFNNSDIMSLDYSDEYDCVSIELKDGKNVLELKAKNRSVAYEKLIISADPQTNIPDFIECYTSSGMLVKTLHFKQIVEFEDGFSRPSVVETDSPLYKGAKSIMIYSQMKRQKLSEELFNIKNMSRYKDLR
jgi:hypothetical protein